MKFSNKDEAGTVPFHIKRVPNQDEINQSFKFLLMVALSVYLFFLCAENPLQINPTH